MATFVATTASNSPRIRDLAGAQRVLERYGWDGDVTAEIRNDESDNSPYLAIYGYGWPCAWRMPEGVSREDFEPDYNDNSELGFEAFLKEIAPHLAEPLTVQACGSENCRFPISACEWHIGPEMTEMEINGFRHSLDERPVTSSRDN